jgi:hypothetical protein
VLALPTFAVVGYSDRLGIVDPDCGIAPVWRRGVVGYSDRLGIVDAIYVATMSESLPDGLQSRRIARKDFAERHPIRIVCVGVPLGCGGRGGGGGRRGETGRAVREETMEGQSVPGRGGADPFYLIVKGKMVPASSRAFHELERIRREADFKEIEDFIRSDDAQMVLPRDRQIRVCGGSRWISIHAQYMALRQMGYDAVVHEPGSYALDYDGA